jgi:hypothetical protein
MQEFSSISVSTYEADGLVGQLNDKATDGWSVVAIVPTGSTITAYLSRARSDDWSGDTTPEPSLASNDASDGASDDASDGESDVDSAEATDESTFASTAAVGAIGADALVPEPAPEPAVEPAPEPAADASFPPVAAEPAPATESTPEPAAEPAVQATASAAPAGWYADPSGRYELRYWDGGTWTEHVSRAGQQYTDPPVA